MSRVERTQGRGRIVLSASSQTLGNLVVALIAVGILRITTHRLGPANYGLFALVITYVTLFSLLADLGITAMTTRELAREGADRASIVSIAMSSRVVLSILAIPVIIGSADLLYPHQDTLFRWSIAVMSSDVLFSTLQAIAATVFTARVRGDIVAAFNLTNRILYLVGVVAVAALHGSYFGYVCAYVGADLVIAVVFCVAARRSVVFGWRGDLSAWWRTLASALPLGAIQLIGNVYSWIDSILLSVLRSSTDLGYYSVAFNVVNVLGSVPSFLMTALVPSLVNADGDERARLVNRAVYVLFCLAAPLAVGGIVLRTDIILVLAGRRFLAASTPLAVLAVTLPVSFLQTAFGYTSVAIDRYRPLLAVGLGTLALNVAANLVLIPRFGPTGAASALLGSEIVSLVSTFFVFRRMSGIRIIWTALWRPSLAALVALGLVGVRGPVWSHLNHLLALLVGASFVGLVYLLCLSVLGGMPDEIPRPHLLGKRHHPKDG